MYEDTNLTEGSEPNLTNSRLPELGKEILDHVNCGKAANSQAKEARVEAKQRFICGGRLLIEAKRRATDFTAFLREHCNGISVSWAYKLIRMAGGEAEVEKVRADARERKRRQRAKASVRDKGNVTHSTSDPDFAASNASETPEASAEKRKALNARLYPEPEPEPEGAETAPDSGVGDTGHLKDEELGSAETSPQSRRLTSRKTSPAEAKGNLKFAIDTWWRLMDDAGKAEMINYFRKKAGVPVS